MEFEENVDLGKGSIILEIVSFVVNFIVRNYFLDLFDY
jgi:hypothetical protein